MDFFKQGDHVKCCGGDDGIIIEISKDKVLLLRLLPKKNQYIVAHYPTKYEDELVWNNGHYFFVENGTAESLCEALNYYMSV